ncbi:MAG: hypothetical protein IE933_13595 [Sphingomonadales bacterium]|nr:hypothetical protein [Sphingomonadales bacterium]MBD3774983.1 hypothetical protein [Paracoccaceae bacterium]
MDWAVAIVGYLLVAGVAIYAFVRGGSPERAGAIAILFWSGADPLYHLLAGASEFYRVDPGHVALDCSLLFVWVIIATKANRIWPLWAAAVQLIASMGHIAAVIDSGGMQRAYFAMTQTPPLLEFLILLGGTWCHVRRENRIGSYSDWRTN